MGKIDNTSTWQLKEKGNNNPIATLKLCVYPYGVSVRHAVVNDKSRLPDSIAKVLDLNVSLEHIFQLFLNDRVPVRKDSYETDKWVMEQLELEKEALSAGRLTNYCGFIGVVNRFQTEKDNYIVSPVETQLYYWGFIAKGFSKLYKIEP